MKDLNIDALKNREMLTFDDCNKILSKALRRTQNFELLAYTLKPASNSVGYLGEYYNLILEYIYDGSKSPQKQKFFVKTLPHKNIDISKLMKDAGIMRKEAHLYVNLLNKLQKYSTLAWCSKCFLGRKDLIILEDVVEMGYQITEDQSKYFTQAQMESVLKSLATMHASSIVYEVKHSVNIGEKFKDVLFELSFLPKNPWFLVGKEAVLKIAANHPDYQSPTIQDYIKTKLPEKLLKIMEIVNPSQKYLNVFCHRDLWAGNMFFKSGNTTERTIFVDFQLCRYSPPAIDVLMALYLGLQPAERKQYMEKYCLFYYEQFRSALKMQDISADEHVTLEQFIKSLEDLTLFGAFYNCLCATVLRLPKHFLSNMKQERPQDLDDFMHVERTKTILKLMQDYPDYCEYVNECVGDLMEFLLRKEIIK